MKNLLITKNKRNKKKKKTISKKLIKWLGL